MKEAGLAPREDLRGRRARSPRTTRSEIGADGYAADAASAVELFKRLLGMQDSTPRRRARGRGLPARREAAGAASVLPRRWPSASTASPCPRAKARACSSAPRPSGVRVPTSCVKQGKCRECLVEVEEGAERLTPLAPQERPPRRPLPPFLPCPHRRGAGTIRCHTLRRGALRIETEARRRSRHAACRSIRPSRATGAACCSTAGRSRRRTARSTAWPSTSARPRSRSASTTSRRGALMATHSFENPQRFGGSDVMARIRYDGEHKGAAAAHAARLPGARASMALPCDPLTDLRAGGGRQHDDARPLLRPGRGRRSARCRTAPSTEEAFRAGRAATTSLAVTAAPAAPARSIRRRASTGCR